MNELLQVRPLGRGREGGGGGYRRRQRGGEKVTAGRSRTKGGETERLRLDRKKLLALHFRLVAPRRANLSPKCEGGDLAGPGGGRGLGKGGWARASASLLYVMI